MTLELMDHPVTIWTVDGVPARMVHEGRRWRVTDVPTPMQEYPWVVPLEPVAPLVGWRFQGTDEHGETRVFDVVSQDDGGWAVVHVWR